MAPGATHIAGVAPVEAVARVPEDVGDPCGTQALTGRRRRISRVDDCLLAGCGSCDLRGASIGTMVAIGIPAILQRLEIPFCGIVTNLQAGDTCDLPAIEELADGVFDIGCRQKAPFRAFDIGAGWRVLGH